MWTFQRSLETRSIIHVKLSMRDGSCAPRKKYYQTILSFFYIFSSFFFISFQLRNDGTAFLANSGLSIVKSLALIPMFPLQCSSVLFLTCLRNHVKRSKRVMMCAQ